MTASQLARMFREEWPDLAVDQETMRGWFQYAIENGEREAVPAPEDAPARQPTADDLTQAMNEGRWQDATYLLIAKVYSLYRNTPSLPVNRFDCANCGPRVAVDEYGCCRTCGKDAAVMPSPARTEPQEPNKATIADHYGAGWLAGRSPISTCRKCGKFIEHGHSCEAAAPSPAGSGEPQP